MNVQQDLDATQTVYASPEDSDLMSFPWPMLSSWHLILFPNCLSLASANEKHL